MEAPMSAADVAAVMGNRNQDFMGGGFYSIFALLMLFAFMRGGLWGNDGNGNCVTEGDLCNANSFNELKSQVGRMSDQQAAIARQTDNAVCNIAYEGARLASETQRQIADCCCTTQRAIDGVNYNMALGNCEIKEAVHAEGEATRALIQQNKMESMQARINQLENQAALDRATCGMVRWPQQATWSVPFPQFGNDCCCGNQRAYF